MVANVLDRYYLAITFLVTVGWQLLGFAIAWTLQFDKITDFTGGSNFFLLALLTLLMGGTYGARNIVASVLVMVWAARLAGFLLFRVLKTGSDTRFDSMRAHFFKFAGFWTGQIVWVWTVSLPVVILNSPAVSAPPMDGGSRPAFGTGRDIAGIVIFAIGLFYEAVGDIQKYRYKSQKPPKGRPCDKGLWKWSRHPPYFGEILVHWGLWTLTLSPTTNGTLPQSARSAQYGSVVAPLFTMVLLLFASGVPTAEKPAAKKQFLMSYSPTSDSADGGPIWRNYKHYLAKTSVLVPIPNAIYRPLPRFVKTWLLLDLPMYQFDEDKDGQEAIQEERDKQAEQQRGHA